MRSEQEIKNRIIGIKQDIYYFKEQAKKYKEIDYSYHINLCKKILLNLEWILQESEDN